ncbi:MAG: adenylate/guanylate cyclase domain-containing protein [bacterium]|nr:adenylate/guanylate cyclase domain-containing protein [bacterium]
MTSSPQGEQLPEPSPTLTEIARLRTLIDEAAAGLRGQQDLLRMRGLALLPEVLQGMAAAEADLMRLETALQNDVTELEQLNALVQTSAMVNSSLDLDTILAQAMDEILNLTHAGRGYILLLNPETGDLEFRIARDLEPEAEESEPSDNGTVHVSRTILTEVMASGRPMLTDNAQTDPRMAGSETIARFVLRSVMCAPLVYKDRMIGAIYVDNRFREGVFTERELNLLTAFGNQTAVAIENALLFSSVQTALREITQIKELTENVFGSITSGVITTNADHIVTTLNAAATGILMRPVEGAVGASLDDLIPRVNVDTMLEQVREAQESLAVETQPDIPGRGRIALAMRVSPLKNTAQELQGVAMVIDDLTAQRERDEVLGLMTRYLPPGMVEQIDLISELALGGERREVTCAFIDVIPYATLASDLRPSQAMQTLNVYLETATQVINDAQGIIDKYMGSEVMVLFNTQLNPNPDHAVAALRMALDVRDAFLGLYQRLGIDPTPHHYRIGINTGVATLGNVGSLNRRSFTAIGDTINLAKRLEENTSGGQIITSEYTLSYLAGQPDGITFQERDPLQVKGRQQLTRIYEIFRA